MPEPIKLLLQKLDPDIAAYIANKEDITKDADRGVLSESRKNLLKKAKVKLENYLTEINRILSKFSD